MKIIPLTQGMATIVDDADYEALSHLKWSFNEGYASRGKQVGDKYTRVMMHREIMNAPKGMDIDHINGNPLDNRRANLRIATRSQNCGNTGKPCTNTSGYKGAFYHKYQKRWCSSITVEGKTISLGYFPDRKRAAQAYNLASVQYRGAFTRLNNVTHNILELKEFGGSY